MKIAIYTRVSTTDQSCAAQLLEVRAYCQSKGWEVAHEFSDVISGTKSSRVGLDQLMVLVRTKAVDAVCAVKIDRMARSMHHFSNLVAEFLKYDVALILTSQGIDTSNSNPCGRFQVNILAAVAAFERDLISERTKAGLAVAKASGKVLGRPSKILPPEPEREAICSRWVAGGRKDGYRGLGKLLGGVAPSTAWRLVRQYEDREDGAPAATRAAVEAVEFE